MTKFLFFLLVFVYFFLSRPHQDIVKTLYVWNWDYKVL